MPVSVRAARSSGTTTACPAALAKIPRRDARLISSRSADTHNPRPGSFASMSGTTNCLGSSTKRTSRASGKISPVTMQRLSRNWLTETASAVVKNSDVWRLLYFRLFRQEIFGLHPSCLHARLHDQGIHLVRREVKAVQRAGNAHALRSFVLDIAQQVVTGATCKIFQRLDPVFSQFDQHGRRQLFELGDFVFNAQFAASRFERSVLLLYMSESARLEFLRGLLVEALDLRKFVNRDIGNIFDAGEAFRSQQLCNGLVNIQRLHEELSPLGKFFLPTLRFFLLRQNVNLPTGELRRQPDILATAADGQ